MRDDKPDIDAMLRHLSYFRDLRDFPATSTEKLALVRTADTRGLITWSRSRASYELTHFGWNELLPKRRFGLPSLMVTAALGGIVGAVTLAVLWLPADRPHRSIHGQPSAAISRMAKSHVLQASLSAKPATPNAAPARAADGVPDASPVIAAGPEASETPGAESPEVADRAAADQAETKTAFKGVKQATTKRSRHKTARRHRRERGTAWAYAASWRGQQFRYAGYGERGSWLGYR
jgi:hypothetical protein